MFNAFLITIREGAEAALVVAIVISVLKLADESRLTRYAWTGVGTGLLVSFAAGALLFSVAGELGEEAAEFFELAATVAAVAVLSYMVVWMGNHGSDVKGNLERKTRKAAGAAGPLAIMLLTFAAISREGLETSLFLFAGTSSASAPAIAAGALLGISLACLVGAAVYRGSSLLNLRLFFRITGVLLIFFAAGILSYSLHELDETGVVPEYLAKAVWDTGDWLGHEEGIGAVLKSTIGYYARPSLLQVAGYWIYLVLMVGLLFAPARKKLPQSASSRF